MRKERKHPIVYSALAALAAILLIGSCAKESDKLSKQLARESFEAWVAKYAPAAYANPYKDIYIEYIERAEGMQAVPVLDNSWLTIDYTGRTLNGDVFVTRTDSISRRVGSFAYTTHFCADFLEYTSSSTKLCEGLKQAFEQIRVGDSVRVYIPLDKGYTTTGMNINSGYSGESGVTYRSLPIVFDLRLQAVTSSPFVWERDSVQRYAERHWAADEYWHDTVGMYARILQANPEGDSIGMDSLVYVYYEEYFMDGFLAATNIDTVAVKWNVYDNSNLTAYEAIPITPSAGTNVSVNNALYITLPRMRRGEVAEVVTVSTWVQGDSGNAMNTPEILPYQPMRYVIHTVNKNKEKDEEEDDDL